MISNPQPSVGWTDEPNIVLSVHVPMLADPKECSRQAYAINALAESSTDPVARLLWAEVARSLVNLGDTLAMEYDHIAEVLMARLDEELEQ